MAVIYWYIFAFSSFKAEINQTMKYQPKLVIGTFVCKVENSKTKIEDNILRLLSLFIVSITGMLFCTTQKVWIPVKSVNLSLYDCISLKGKPKIDVIFPGIGFIKTSRDDIMNLALIGFLCILGIH